MTASEPATAVYELPLSPEPSRDEVLKAVPAGTMPEKFLLENVLWFCRFRWMVVGAMVVFGTAAYSADLVATLGLRPPGLWPFAVAAILTGMNLAFIAHGRYLARAAAPQGAVINLWAQIVSDLVVLTVVVHFTGSLETPLPFTYLFHIVLACIFFSRSASLAVTGISSALYVACVAAEEAGVITPGNLYGDDVFPRSAAFTWPHVAFILAIWLVVWYLASHLSAMVRLRDVELAEANRRLVLAQEERRGHMLATTHQLKAPFAAVHANAQLLLKGHCGVLSPEVSEVVNRIAARCARLARDIQDMLQLANLQSVSQSPIPSTDLSLVDVLHWSIAQVQPMVQERRISFKTRLAPARAVGVEDHLKTLFYNLLSNAVTYSYPGSEVRVQCAADADGATVSIEDDGIGIVPEKLPCIFDEHYRTDEAVRHNRESSGLGLAIVRHIAQTYGIRVRVSSRLGRGTRFDLYLPSGEKSPLGKGRKEMQDGASVDH